MSTPVTPAQALANAIAIAEGYGVPNAIPTVANNPGDLVLGDMGNGTMGSAGVTVFSSSDEGGEALLSQAQSILDGSSSYYNPNQTIAQVGQTYSGSNSGEWANNVASVLGTTPDTPIGQAAANAAGGGSITDMENQDAGVQNSSPAFGSKSGGGSYLTDWISIAVGLVMIAAGAFSFKTTQIVVSNAVKGAKRVAEISG